MSRSALRRVHLAASVTALVVVASFLLATLTVEALGSEPEIAAVKHWIARALVLLVPAVAAAGLTGRLLAGGSRAPVVRRKLRRMKIVGATGVFVLVPFWDGMAMRARRSARGRSAHAGGADRTAVRA